MTGMTTSAVSASAATSAATSTTTSPPTSAERLGKERGTSPLSLNLGNVEGQTVTIAQAPFDFDTFFADPPQISSTPVTPLSSRDPDPAFQKEIEKAKKNASPAKKFDFGAVTLTATCGATSTASAKEQKS